METTNSPSDAGALDIEAIRRYGRHLILPEIGWEGQEKLLASRILLVGAGGLGSPAALYLAAAGVGTVGIADGDRVEMSNLQRQILFTVSDVGRPKAEAATDRLRALNPLVDIRAVPERLHAGNAMAIIRDYDVVVDGSDNFPTRYLVNDACRLLGKPDIFGAIHRFEGQAGVFAPGGPCYRCFFAEPPRAGLIRTCAEAGVLGVLPGIVGSIQAAEAIKLVLGLDGTLTGRLLLLDALTMRFRELSIARDPACPLCGNTPTITELMDYEEFCGLKTGTITPCEQVTVARFSAIAAGEEPGQIVELREKGENPVAAVTAARVMDLDTLLRMWKDLDTEHLLVLTCKFGIRSQAAVRLLREAGYPGPLASLQDGLLGWLRYSEKTAAGDGE